MLIQKTIKGRLFQRKKLNFSENEHDLKTPMLVKIKFAIKTPREISCTSIMLQMDYTLIQTGIT